MRPITIRFENITRATPSTLESSATILVASLSKLHSPTGARFAAQRVMVRSSSCPIRGEGGAALASIQSPMVNSPALERLLADAVPLEAHEAVAVAQQVVYNRVASGEPVAVEEFADVLGRLLAATPRMPAALRYAAARAVGDVQAPPFESVEELALALKRFEKGDRVSVVRGVLARTRRPVRPTRPRLATAAAAIAASALIGAAAGTAWNRRASLPEASRFAAVPASPTVVVPPVQGLPLPSNAAARRTDVAPSAARRDSATVDTAPAAKRVAPPIVRAVANDPAPEFSPAFRDDGSSVMFHTGRTRSESSAIKSAAPIDGGIQILTIVDDGARNFHVQPSPDGTRIAFDSDRDGERAVYVANADGTDVQRLTTGGYAAVPTWSPDSRQIAFIRAEPDRPRVWNIWLLTLGTRELRRLTEFRYGQTWGASWFNDGRRIAYSHESQLAVRDLSTGAEQTYRSPVPGRLIRTPAVSPDGDHVIFQVSGNGAWLLDLRDGSMRCVLSDPSAEEFAWAPDGRRVAFHSQRDGQWGVWIMAPTT